MNANHKILVLDDRDTEFAQMLAGIIQDRLLCLSNVFFEARSSRTIQAATIEMSKSEFDIIIIDRSLPETDSKNEIFYGPALGEHFAQSIRGEGRYPEMAAKIKEGNSKALIVLVTGMDDYKDRIIAGIDMVFEKPLFNDDYLMIAKKGLEKQGIPLLAEPII